MNQREAERALKFWQKQLGLLDWDIEVEIVRYYREDLAYHLGTIRENHEHRRAWIYLKHPRDVAEGANNSLEETLVHELLHIWFAHVEMHGGSLAEEQAINAISNALCNLSQT